VKFTKPGRGVANISESRLVSAFVIPDAPEMPDDPDHDPDAEPIVAWAGPATPAAATPAAATPAAAAAAAGPNARAGVMKHAAVASTSNSR
jgi:hypothetical protein